MGKKDEYCATMEWEMKKWDTAVDNLNAKGKQMSADARVGCARLGADVVC